MTEFITNLIVATKDIFGGNIGYLLFILLIWGFISLQIIAWNALLDYLDKS